MFAYEWAAAGAGCGEDGGLGAQLRHKAQLAYESGGSTVSEGNRWVVRLVGQDEVDPRTLVEHPRNPKIHTGEQDRVVTASLNELGWLRRVLWNRRTGHVLDGHERLKLAIAEGERTVPRDICDVAEADEPKVLLLLDQTANLAQPALERWAALREDVRTEEPALLDFFASWAADHGVTAPEFLGGGEPDAVEESELPEDQVDAAVERWQVQPGDLWICGRHRLICDDCLNPDVLERLLGGVTPTMVVADPPYGVSIVQGNGYVGGGEAYAIPFGGVAGETKQQRDTRVRVSGGQRVKAKTGRYPIELAQGRSPRGTVGAAKPFGSRDARGAYESAKSIAVGKYAPVLGDASPEVARRAATFYLTTYPRAIQVWWGANYYTEVLPASSCWLVWDKETTGNFADCELAWTNHGGAVKRLVHRWNGMLRASERERRWHPTQKPAALMAWVYEVVGTPDAVVLDPCLGSGPTLLAAEQTGPTVFGVELSPENVAIALERWARLSHGVPRRAE